MRFPKLFLSALTGCLLVGVSSGAAMASCGVAGILYNETFTGALRVDSIDLDCTIISSTITGDLIFANVNDVTLVGNTVGGNLRVDGDGNGTATVVGNTVYSGNLVVREMEIANVAENQVNAGRIRVIENISARVLSNNASGPIRCKNNTDLLAAGNISGTAVRCDTVAE